MIYLLVPSLRNLDAIQGLKHLLHEDIHSGVNHDTQDIYAYVS